METTTLLQSSSSIFQPSNLVVKSVNRTDSLYFGSKLNLSNGFLKKHCGSISVIKNGQKKLVLGGGRRRSCVVRASSSSSAGSLSDAPIAPLQLESPIGQLLSQILKSHPHLVPAAVDQQLEQLQTDRDAEKVNDNPKEEPSSTGTDLVLYRRIAEVKANERKKALEEIMYALIVQKFMDADVSLIPSISSSFDPSGKVDSWPTEEEKLQVLHSEEAYEMIKIHLGLILGNRLGESNAVAQISKIRVGQVYAASVMYGYFLKRVDQRFQLEKSMKLLPFGSDEEDNDIVQSVNEELRRPNRSENVRDVEPTKTHPEVSSWPGEPSPGGFGSAIKSSRLRNYVMSIDADTLQSYAARRSKEADSIIENHTNALFGRPEIVITPQGTIDSSKEEQIKISFVGLKRLVLEAVTFGSFLWDVESHVDSRYHFVMN
ncbi:hypothetical protein AQUCO_00201316v1 [Aquilegia coerulea]|uniref:UV-B-induced protein At3g17800, chloroplastic n=1 Tax=Aquilegia coerulea TaxID=218851 RepID=A0A2G5F7C9_AQUCA|nr:hypothetical protein AQUCO_00201316v1 [Aquilegia coerulea]